MIPAAAYGRVRHRPEQPPSSSAVNTFLQPRGYRRPLETTRVLSAIEAQFGLETYPGPSRAVPGERREVDETSTLSPSLRIEGDDSSSLSPSLRTQRRPPSLAVTSTILPVYGEQRLLEPPLLFHKSGSGHPNDSVLASSRPYIRGDGYPNRTWVSGEAFVVTKDHERLNTAKERALEPRVREPQKTMVGIFDRAGASLLSAGSPTARFYETTASEVTTVVDGEAMSASRFVPGKAAADAVSRRLDRHHNDTQLVANLRRGGNRKGLDPSYVVSYQKPTLGGAWRN